MDRRTLLGRIGALGTALVAGCTGNGDGEPTETPEPTPTATDPPTDTPAPTPTPEPTPAADAVVNAGPDGRLVFQPDSFSINAGETVRWVFRSAGHNVKPEAIPEGASWAGTAGDQFDTVPSGGSYDATFTVPGTYEYVCRPHESAGMVGSFTVEE